MARHLTALRTVLVHPWGFFVLASGSGALAGFSVVPWGAPPLLWFSLVPLWEAVSRRSILQGFMPAAGWGGAALLTSHVWLLWLHPLDWLGVPDAPSRLLTVLLWLLVGGGGSLAVGLWWWLARFYPLPQFRDALTMALLWGCGEVLLARGPLFWLGLSTVAAIHDRALAGLGSLAGPGGLAAVQVLVGWWLWRSCRTPSCQRSRWWAGGAVVVVALHGLGLVSLADTQGPSVPIGVLQPAIPTRQKFTWTAMAALERRLVLAMNRVAQKGAPWLLVPEGTLALDQSPPVVDGVGLVTGGFRRQQKGLRNSLLVYPVGAHDPAMALDKHRLVLLGEWLPWSGLLANAGLSAVGGLQPGPEERLLAGQPLPWQAGVAICYEISQAHALADATHAGAQLLLAVANLDPYPGLLHRQFLALAQQRAIETGRWLVVASNTGPTALVNSRGKITAQLDPAVVASTVWNVPLRTDLTVYSRTGDWPLVISGLLLVLSRRPMYHEPARVARAGSWWRW
ncbi:apolipoprotein N-acyltransferase [Candidatus Synechococcus spongiarum]|nr:nitrilase-related carbon-nitrogen hydrolase [Candidatus Synechococcus spongiarum]MCY4360166.1 apolipoprotein N-acyltransferase [Cyanobacteria bacterium MAG APA_bin_95]